MEYWICMNKQIKKMSRAQSIYDFVANDILEVNQRFFYFSFLRTIVNCTNTMQQ